MVLFFYSLSVRLPTSRSLTSAPKQSPLFGFNLLQSPAVWICSVSLFSASFAVFMFVLSPAFSSVYFVKALFCPGAHTHTVLSLLAKWLLTHFLRGRLWDCLDLTDTQENNHWLELSESKWRSSFKQGSTNIYNLEERQLFNWKWNISYQWKAALHSRSLGSWQYVPLESCGPASSTHGHW